MNLNTLAVGERGYVTGLGKAYSFTVVSQGPGGTRVSYDKRIISKEFTTIDDLTGEETIVKFTKPAETVLISGTTTVTKLATDTESVVYQSIMTEQKHTSHTMKKSPRTRKTSIAPKLLSIPDEFVSVPRKPLKTKRKRKSS